MLTSLFSLLTLPVGVTGSHTEDETSFVRSFVYVLMNNKVMIE